MAAKPKSIDLKQFQEDLESASREYRNAQVYFAAAKDRLDKAEEAYLEARRNFTRASSSVHELNNVGHKVL